MKLKFIYWFTFYNTDSPTVRYRGQYPLEYFKKEFGINSYLVFPGYHPSKVFFFLKAYFSALLFPKKDSLIVFQSIYSNFMYVQALKLLAYVRKNKCVYDLDDADYLRYPPKTIYHFIKNCAAVTVGSAELVKNLSALNTNTIRIPCPTPDLQIVKQKRNALLTLGWIGDFSKGHKESLINYFFPALHNLPFKVKLIVLGVTKEAEHLFLNNYFKGYDNVVLEIPENVDWKNETDIQHRIASFDIGIATLLDTEFYRSKSAFKTKQCFNNGVPVLSSDIAENNLFIAHDKNGFLCATPSDFKQRIIEIKQMSDEDYFKLSTNARQSIRNFDLNCFCESFISLCKTKLSMQHEI